jgi:hypothetical protein
MPPDAAPSPVLADATGREAARRDADDGRPRHAGTGTGGGPAKTTTDVPGEAVAGSGVVVASGAVSVLGGILGGLFEM